MLEGMDFQTDEYFSYLNTATGEVVSVTTEELRAAEEAAPLEDFPEWQHDAICMAKDIAETEHYLPLPDRFEMHEYQIMERFCLSVDDEDMRVICVTPYAVEERSGVSTIEFMRMGLLKRGTGIVMQPCER